MNFFSKIKYILIRERSHHFDGYRMLLYATINEICPKAFVYVFLIIKKT